jgi:hypothetical protein
MSLEYFWQDLPLDTSSRPGANYREGAENTKLRRTPPRQTSGFFCAPSFPQFSIPLSHAGRAPNTRPFGGIKPPTLAGFQRPAPFCGVNSHRLKIELRRLP